MSLSDAVFKQNVRTSSKVVIETGIIMLVALDHDEDAHDFFYLIDRGVRRSSSHDVSC